MSLPLGATPDGARTAPVPVVRDAQSLRGEVANRLITAVAIGDYVPGERIPAERELALALGVGRVTVRAAISQLVAAGLLRSKQGRGGGTFVVDPETSEAKAAIEQALTAVWERLVDQHVAECWLHGSIAAAAAERHEPADREILTARLEEYRAAASGAPSRKADERLHLSIAHAAHNPSLSDALLALERSMHLAAPAHPWGPESGWAELEQRSLRDHERLIVAILARDVPAAHEIGRTHARINLEMLEATLREAKLAASNRANVGTLRED